MLPLSVFLNQLSTRSKTLTRKLERLQKQLINCSLGVKFLKICSDEGLLPNFTDIKPYDPAIREADFTRNYRNEQLQHALEKQLIRKSQLEN